MRLLLSVFNQTGRGTYWRAYHLSRELAKRGHAVTLMCTSPGERQHVHTRMEEGFALVEFPDLFRGSLRSGWDPWNTWNRIAWLSHRQFDLVHAFESRPVVIYPSLAAKKRGIPLVMDWSDWFGRGGSVEERPNRLVRLTLRPVETFYEEHFRTRANGSTVICTALREKALALGVKAESICHLPNGSDTDNFPNLSVQEARRLLGLPEDGFLIGYVGSIFRRDADLLAQAFDQARLLIPDARLVIAGYCPVDVRSLVQRPEAVIQTGTLELDVLRHTLSACDVFWLPLSDSTANRGRFPLKLNDYLAAGRAVVASAVGDIPRIYKLAEFGYLTAPDPSGFADRTLALYQDPGRRIAMGRAARRLAETRLNWTTLAGELEGFYERILGERKM